MNTVCFTGHRPQNLPYKFNENDWECIKIKSSLKDCIEKAINGGYTRFISGMAMGVDTWAAETVLELKKAHPHIKLEALIPCLDQCRYWSDCDKRRYYSILKQCDRKILLQKSYTPGCMQNRNRQMVERSDYVIAVWNGHSGGTAQTINYARRHEKKLAVISVK
ncbi:MAG: DUF1273 domain-containing protein [Oscillospiraceae bacterium]|jgi:uncharacterized phage-like protein YoqJ|nr:DUF1273 domain-containing protein [Oscillospiraceae bacterium]